jgi:hypothetical protein
MATDQDAALILDTDLASVQALGDELNIPEDDWDEQALLQAAEILDDESDDDDGDGDDEDD